MDGRPNRRNKAAFSSLSGIVWTEPRFALLLDLLNRLKLFFLMMS